MSLVYIDTAGNYGNAEDIVIFDTECFEDSEIGELNKILDEGTPPYAWIIMMGEKLNRVQIIVENSITTLSPKVHEISKRLLKKRFGI